jgi:phosphoglycolate phosphatase
MDPLPRLSFDVVVFDLDGTLADTAPDLAAALNHALAALGRPPVPLASVRRMVGPRSAGAAAARARRDRECSDALVEAAFPRFIEFYGANICDGTRAYPGVERAFCDIERSGARLAVCTNKPERLARELLRALGWREWFKAVVGGDTLPSRKPDPAPLVEAIGRAGGGSALLVGDSITDSETARAAGLPFVAVSFGFRDRPVEALGADAVIDHFDGLLPAIAQLRPRLAVQPRSGGNRHSCS